MPFYHRGGRETLGGSYLLSWIFINGHSGNKIKNNCLYKDAKKTFNLGLSGVDFSMVSMNQQCQAKQTESI